MCTGCLLTSVKRSEGRSAERVLSYLCSVVCLPTFAARDGLLLISEELVLSITLSKRLGALFSLLPGHLLEASGNQVQAPTSRAFMLKFAATLPPTLAFVTLPDRTSLYIAEQTGTKNSTINVLKF